MTKLTNTSIVLQALGAVTAELEKFDPKSPALNFARGVLMGSAVIVPVDSTGMQRARGPRVKLSPEQQADIAHQYDTGTKFKDLVKKYRTSSKTITAALKAQGVKVRNRGRSRAELNINDVVNDYASGLMNMQQIAKKHHCGVKRIHQALVDNGVTIRLPGKFARPETIDEKIIKDYVVNRLGQKKLSEKYGFSAKKIRGILVDNGVTLMTKAEGARLGAKTRWGTASVVSLADRAVQIAKRYADEVPVNAILNEFGLKNPPQLYKYLRMAGVEPSRKVRGIRARAN